MMILQAALNAAILEVLLSCLFQLLYMLEIEDFLNELSARLFVMHIWLFFMDLCHFNITLIKSSSTFFCSLLKASHLSRTAFCSMESSTASESEKNSASVIPRPAQIFSSDEIEGCIFFRYQVEIVDCVMPLF